MPKAVTIISGGLDSTVLAYHMLALGFEQQLLSFDYGQRHAKEIEFAAQTASTLAVDHKTIDLSYVGRMLKGSALSDRSVEVPEGHYSADNMALTVVPNRNAIMLSIAWGVACAQQAEVLCYGAHKGDYAQYPDCRLSFVTMLQMALLNGTEGCRNENLHLVSPFIDFTKADIVKRGLELGVNFNNTWSCYKGQQIACGKCGTCVERLEAFALNNFEDPIKYKDREFWRQAVNDYNREKGT